VSLNANLAVDILSTETEVLPILPLESMAVSEPEEIVGAFGNLHVVPLPIRVMMFPVAIILLLKSVVELPSVWKSINGVVAARLSLRPNSIDPFRSSPKEIASPSPIEIGDRICVPLNETPVLLRENYSDFGQISHFL
jgi:hypothetical protein